MRLGSIIIEHDLFGKPLHTFPDHALDPDRAPDLDHRLLSDAGIAPVGELLVRHEEKCKEHQDPENGSDHHAFLPRAQSRLRWWRSRRSRCSLIRLISSSST